MNNKKCIVSVKCINQNLKDLVIQQYLDQVPIVNRKAYIKSSVRLLDNNAFEFSVGSVSSQIPVLMYGHKEGLHTTNLPDVGNNYEVTFECHDGQADKIGKFIHNQLCGLDEYINNLILLNIQDNIVTVLFGAECDYDPIFLFIEE